DAALGERRTAVAGDVAAQGGGARGHVRARGTGHRWGRSEERGGGEGCGAGWADAVAGEGDIVVLRARVQAGDGLGERAGGVDRVVALADAAAAGVGAVVGRVRADAALGERRTAVAGDVAAQGGGARGHVRARGTGHRWG